MCRSRRRFGRRERSATQHPGLGGSVHCQNPSDQVWYIWLCRKFTFMSRMDPEGIQMDEFSRANSIGDWSPNFEDSEEQR